MTGKEIIRQAFALEKTERIPWVPFVGVHGAFLLDQNASTYLKSADFLTEGVQKAIEEYKPDGIPVAFDLQIEAEALGCQLAWADDNPPVVIDHPLSEGKDIKDFKIPGKEEGRIPIVLEATRNIRENNPDIALYGLITGPFTLALHLLGTDIFVKMFEEPEYVGELMDFTTSVAKTMAGYYIDAGCDVVAIVDPMTSQIDQDSFANFVTPSATKVFDFIRKKGALSSFFVCGHAQHNIEGMCQCKPDNISIDENIPLDYVRDTALKHKISFGGNMKLTIVFLMGTKADVQFEVMECLKNGGNQGFVLAPGCDLPMETPMENIRVVRELLDDPYEQEVIRTQNKTPDSLNVLNMKDYGKSDKVIIDVITLDSESCAPCQYMVEAVKRVAPYFEDIVIWREHPIKKMDSVSIMASLMVKNIPTICIDGKIAFVSQIPPQHELVEAIQKRINEKFRLKIGERRSQLMIFGNKEETEILRRNVNQAMLELGKNPEIININDQEEQEQFGVMQTPAIAIRECKVKSQGDVPSVEVIKEWIKEL